MFTGIIQEIGGIGSIARKEPWTIEIKARKSAPKMKKGDSISVSGICLTAVELSDASIFVQLTKESRDRSVAREWKTGGKVNLELARGGSERLDGHIVQGHIDGTGRVLRFAGGSDRRLFIKPDLPPGPLIVEKGSISIDGVSLTIATLESGGEFSVALIPLTIEETTLGDLKPGGRVNLEYDIIGKYVARLARL
jgi:riboflavin synthase